MKKKKMTFSKLKKIYKSFNIIKSLFNLRKLLRLSKFHKKKLINQKLVAHNNNFIQNLLKYKIVKINVKIIKYKK